MKYGTPGSISSGTMREEDLFPCFIDELKRLECDEKWLANIEYDMIDKDSNYFNTDESAQDMTLIWDKLNELAPHGYYFGANEGDGADYEFWKIEE